MISNQIIQHTIEGMREITDTDMLVMDSEANILARAGKGSEDFSAAVKAFAGSEKEQDVLLKSSFFKVYDDGQLAFIVMVKGDTKVARMIGQILGLRKVVRNGKPILLLILLRLCVIRRNRFRNGRRVIFNII